MDNKYNTQEFINTLTSKIKGGMIPVCPYCGGTEFTTTDEYASIVLSKEYKGLELGNYMPCGTVICKKCGHIEFFSLGVLGMLPKKGESNE